MDEFIAVISIPVMGALVIIGVSQTIHQQRMEHYKVVSECRKSLNVNKNPDIVCGNLPKFD